MLELSVHYLFLSRACSESPTRSSATSIRSRLASRAHLPLPLARALSLCRNMSPMLGHSYRKSVAEEGGRNTGRTWTEDGQRRQAELLARLHRLYTCPPGRGAEVFYRPGHLFALLEEKRGGGCKYLRGRGCSMERRCHVLTPS